jgi:hypothetical protein
MTDEDGDPMLRTLRRLPVLEPDTSRAERVRTRCRSTIARRHEQAESPGRPRAFTAYALVPALVGGLCLMYLSAVVHDLLRLRGIH